VNLVPVVPPPANLYRASGTKARVKTNDLRSQGFPRSLHVALRRPETMKRARNDEAGTCNEDQTV